MESVACDPSIARGIGYITVRYLIIPCRDTFDTFRTSNMSTVPYSPASPLVLHLGTALNRSSQRQSLQSTASPLAFGVRRSSTTQRERDAASTPRILQAQDTMSSSFSSAFSPGFRSTQQGSLSREPCRGREATSAESHVIMKWRVALKAYSTGSCV